MTLLRNTVVVVLSAACLFGCETVSPDQLYGPEERMLFSTPQMSVETRSTLKESLTDGDAFGVIGYCIPYFVGTDILDAGGAASTWSIKRNLCPPNVFYEQKVSVSTSGCIYDMEGDDRVNNPKYWYRWDNGVGYGLDGDIDEDDIVTSDAGDYRYSFFAYYPYPNSSGFDYESFKVVSPSNNTTAGAPKLSFYMPQSGTVKTDLLDHKKTPDAMLGVIYNATAGSNLQFTMYHVLTGLGFEVNNFSDLDLTIHSIKLSGSFYKRVDIDYTASAVSYTFPSDRYAGTYTIYDGGEEGMLLPGAGDNEAGTSSESPIGGEHILLISGQKDAYFGEGVHLIIDYTFGGERKVRDDITRPGSFTPVPGVKYTAQLNFVGDAFVLQFIVDNGDVWEDGELDDGDDSNDDVIFQ